MRVLCLVPVLLACAGCAADAPTADAYPRRPTAQEIVDVEGLYALSDGYRAHIFGLDSQLYVRIGAGPQKQLMLVGPEHLASPSGDVSIRFEPERAGDNVKRVAVAYYRNPGARPPLIFSTGPRPGRGFLD
jgi:hypothetical protein